MKRILLFFVFLIVANATKAQPQEYAAGHNTISPGFFVGVFAGAGLATNYNYDIGPCGGIEFYKPLGIVEIGAIIEYQEYSLYYQKFSPYAPFQPGYAGVTLRNLSDYIFFAPEINIPMPSERFRSLFSFHINGGVGNLLSGKEELHKWDFSNAYPLYTIANYDSVRNTSTNINKMIYRYGFGFTEHARVYGRQMFFTITEDFSFVPGDLSTTSGPNYPGRTKYSPTKLSPVYISLKVGVTFYHVKH